MPSAEARFSCFSTSVNNGSQDDWSSALVRRYYSGCCAMWFCRTRLSRNGKSDGSSVIEGTINRTDLVYKALRVRLTGFVFRTTSLSGAFMTDLSEVVTLLETEKPSDGC